MYTGRTFNRESVYVCGDYMDGDIYPVFQAPGKRRSRCKPTSEIQQKLNQKNAEKKLTRLVHSNFTEDDIALHLTYRPGEEPQTEEEAQHILSNYIRRLKRRYAKLGMELKYISCTEYGKTSGRVHHHVILSGGLDRDTIEKVWGLGVRQQQAAAVQRIRRDRPCALHRQGQAFLQALEPEPEPDHPAVRAV